jgi:glutamyl-tRNA synthetase
MTQRPPVTNPTPTTIRRTRLAPSPTGALHLGNARTFLATWLLARQNGWKVLLRIEDLDGPRVKQGAAHQAIDDLVWLGLDWDEGPIFQSPRTELYDAAINDLVARKWAYPCVCSRREAVLAASAPHADEHQTIYPGTCRDRFQYVSQARSMSGKPPAIRFRVPDLNVEFFDAFRGKQSFDVHKQLGDFVIAKADGTPAYQLAVVVDDADMGVTDVIRGDDLIDSSPRQMLVYRALDRAKQIPTYTHLPLVVGTDGRRLAKRHGDTRLSHYREQGVSPECVIALLATWLGIPDVGDSVDGLATPLVGRFDLSRVSREPLVHDETKHSLIKPKGTKGAARWNRTTTGA